MQSIPISHLTREQADALSHSCLKTINGNVHITYILHLQVLIEREINIPWWLMRAWLNHIRVGHKELSGRLEVGRFLHPLVDSKVSNIFQEDENLQIKKQRRSNFLYLVQIAPREHAQDCWYNIGSFFRVNYFSY